MPASVRQFRVFHSARAAQEPTEVVKALVNPALQILADKTTPLMDRQEKLRDLVNGNFDFVGMAPTRAARLA